ncbi:MULTISPECIES: hypothetical protein [unclassified Geobacillus]|uniref:hypothetical protein n=1 Tax=unclassified Geobacillus TaxID=2642459 RepID=UPI0001D58219|nr:MULTISPECIES: hypothetical protein [unclassified Geobacillus]ADI25437.1 hypothetical protein GC56T3_0380 [Geobacillus sp. C56-T3]OPX02500.1 hypothetical protein B1A75_12565 [Geobacillus sp. LEMMY01]
MRRFSFCFLSSVFLLVIALFSPTSRVGAEQFIQNKVKLKNVFVDIHYDKSQVNLVRTEDQNSTKISLVDKKSGKILETYGEIIQPLEQVATKTVGMNDASVANASGTYSISTVYRERNDGPAVSRLSTQLYIYSYDSFRQINKVLNTWWSEASGGSWYLTRDVANTVSMTGSFPTTKVQTSGSATIEVKTSYSITGSFSISALKEAGFTYGYSSGSDIYYRKPINLGFVYSLY